jgi:hypothetical protein
VLLLLLLLLLLRRIPREMVDVRVKWYIRRYFLGCIEERSKAAFIAENVAAYHQ